MVKTDLKMAKLSTVLGLFFLLLAVSSAAGVTVNGTVYLEGSKFRFAYKVVDKQKGVAYGFFNDGIFEDGWGVLDVAAGYSSSQHYTDEEVMTAAGVLEGVMTHRHIYDIYVNLYNTSFSGQSAETIAKVKGFYQEQREWMEAMIEAHSATSDYWYYTSLIYAQFKGLMLGYAMAAPEQQQLDEFAFDFLNGNGDFLDIRSFLFPDERPDVATLTREGYLSLLYKGRCSALIKVLPGYENVFASHSSWYTYSAMNRIYKHYAFKSSKGEPATTVMSFSSYPGYLSSLDDFYIMDSGLVMLQTTNMILNKTVYDKATPMALLAWHRVRLANWLAKGGKDWADIVSQYNSGTYNNQYMVLDLKKVEIKKAIYDDALWIVEQIPGLVRGLGMRLPHRYGNEAAVQVEIVSQIGAWLTRPHLPEIKKAIYDDALWIVEQIPGPHLPEIKKVIYDDALWIVEQIPGYVESGDQTPVVREGYWPSYNIPFYEDIFTMSGYPEMVAKLGPDATYELCPRAKIFRRDQSNVHDLETMKYLMRYNDYRNDPYSEGNPMNAICSRGDLRDPPDAGGCYDTKVTDYYLAQQQVAFAENGPTHQGLPPFDWRTSEVQVPHLGQPDLFNFDFIGLRPIVP